MLGHAQDQLAIVEQQPGAGLDRLKDLAMRQFDAGLVAGGRIAVEHEAGAAGELHAAGGELADAQLGALKVGKDGGGATVAFFQCADRLDHRHLRRLVAVAHVNAERIGTGLEQPGDHLGRVAGRAQCGEHAHLAAAGGDRSCHVIGFLALTAPD